jgi:hypothetical protein
LHSFRERSAIRDKKPSPFYSSKKGKSAMIASYQFIINVIADYIEIVMLSIGMIIFLASE